MNSNYDNLFLIAEAQDGYFTIHQASLAGYSRKDISASTKRGKFIRVFRGIYRIKHYPSSENEDIMVAILKSGPRAVASHDTALAIYQLSDIMPAAIHLTIPKNRSRRHPEIRYHTSKITPQEITFFNGLPITTVERTITDGIRGGIEPSLMQQAINQAIQRGMITKSSLMEQANKYGNLTRNEVKTYLGE
ncbi:MAG: hypothetical protein GYA34_12710 [Chloroflexi bacterium]|nr:hypothetical protein [Chloroflexota bacterium]